jgi:hypothetical protein
MSASTRLFFVGLVFALLVSTPVSAALLGDFNGDGSITTHDVVFLLAWVQTGRGTDVSVIDARAKVILPSITTSCVNLPTLTKDDLNGDTLVTTHDVVFLLAWIQIGRTFDATTIETRAKAILAAISTSLSKFPGLEIGSATIPITIEGITSN